jgi:putative tricarboxylic transport membrane protein
MTQTTRERREQLIWLAVMAVIGIVAIVGGLAYGLVQEERVGPGVMPFVAGLLILVPLVIQAVRRVRMPVDDAPPPEEDALEGAATTRAQAGAARTPHVVVIFLLVALTVALTYLIGLLISVSLLVGALFLLNDRRKPVTALIALVIAGVFGWVVFETLLDVPLPRGLLGLI